MEINLIRFGITLPCCPPAPSDLDVYGRGMIDHLSLPLDDPGHHPLGAMHRTSFLSSSLLQICTSENIFPLLIRVATALPTARTIEPSLNVFRTSNLIRDLAQINGSRNTFSSTPLLGHCTESSGSIHKRIYVDGITWQEPYFDFSWIIFEDFLEKTSQYSVGHSPSTSMVEFRYYVFRFLQNLQTLHQVSPWYLSRRFFSAGSRTVELLKGGRVGG